MSTMAPWAKFETPPPPFQLITDYFLVPVTVQGEFRVQWLSSDKVVKSSKDKKLIYNRTVMLKNFNFFNVQYIS